MSAAPRRPMPTSKSGLALTPKVEPIHTAPPATAVEPEESGEQTTSAPAPSEAPAQEPKADLAAAPAETSAIGADKRASRSTSSSPPKVSEKKARKQRSTMGPAEDGSGPRPDEGTKGPEDRTRASNVQLPTSLYEQVEAMCLRRKLTHGELILVAVETTYDRLEKLVHPTETIGGKLFAARASNSNPTSDSGFKTPMNYRLREGDFAILDQVATELSARSRNHLIVAALTGYLEQK